MWRVKRGDRVLANLVRAAPDEFEHVEWRRSEEQKVPQGSAEFRRGGC